MINSVEKNRSFSQLVTGILKIIQNALKIFRKNIREIYLNNHF